MVQKNSNPMTIKYCLLHGVLRKTLDINPRLITRVYGSILITLFLSSPV